MLIAVDESRASDETVDESRASDEEDDDEDEELPVVPAC